MTTSHNTIDWDRATAECVEHLQALIRIPSVNPPGVSDGAAGRDSSGGETAAARYCAEVLVSAGIAAQVLETLPGRGSCFARLPATVANADPPLVLLSHLDVVPVDAESWTHDPFGGELIDGVIWGRGAVDMKDMVAMELSVMLALARFGGERSRDVIFAAVADEEAGGVFGAGHWVSERPDLFADASGRPAAAALNEVGGYSMTIGGRRIYAIQVAEKGIAWTRMRATGTTGHGSMPHPDNAALKLAEAVTRLNNAPRPARVTPVVDAFLGALDLSEVADAIRAGDEAAAFGALESRVDDPVLRRSLSAMLRDTVTTTMIQVGKKMNVIPGSGEAQIDIRTLPGTDQDALIAELQATVGDLAQVEPVVMLPSIEAAGDAPLVGLMRNALLSADPEAMAAPMMITLGTDAKALATIGIPVYGFAPLQLGPADPFLSLFHGHDERVPVSALRFGLPVLHEVVSRFASAEPGLIGD
ncbi:MAG TPA: M20/M25/M40 family metallo-hydrolase [Methylomirabilota bacterium]|nr:M20/M25/M40 family metallo-hydrolase [Methylomirabilota bacterium]